MGNALTVRSVSDGKNMEPVVQEETTGCGIAASAALAGISYAEAKRTANALGIYADDTALWSESVVMQRCWIPGRH